MSLNLAGVILAAGLSRRMGRFKPLLTLGGRSLLARAVACLDQAGVHELRVVTGHLAEELRPALEDLGLAEVHNPDYARDMYTSVRAGVAALPQGIDAFFLLPVDIPLVRPASLNHLRPAFAAARPAVALPTFLGQLGHPPLIAADLIPAILAWPGQGGLQGLLERYADRTLRVPVADQGVLLDMDTPEDHAHLQAVWERRRFPNQDEMAALLDEVQAAPAAVVAHGQAVARAARALGEALVAAGNPLDLETLEAAARCHDLAKGQPDHAQAGAAVLRDWGWPRVAELVARHADIDPPAQGPVGADEVLYLADKLVEGDRPVDMDQRFQAKLERHGGEPGAVMAIERRWNAARAIRGRIAAVCGRDQVAVR